VPASRGDTFSRGDAALSPSAQDRHISPRLK
jgi:hypothetical protein